MLSWCTSLLYQGYARMSNESSWTWQHEKVISSPLVENNNAGLATLVIFQSQNTNGEVKDTFTW